VVISPHLDDAALSLGACIAAAAAAGARIEILTVFAGDPDSRAAPGPWDLKSGFSSEGQAARERRLEDREACATLGAVPHWLPFGDEQYSRHGDALTVGAAVAAIAEHCDALLLPGFPLVNPDHAWLSRTLLSRSWPGTRLGLYAEQPYLFAARRLRPTPGPAAALEGVLRTAPAWSRCTPPAAHRQLKRRAIGAYRSQRRQLGLGSWRLRHLLWHEQRQGGEAIAWIT
jgi:LmbE family N-acetylglucosaminyl deacetylase